MGNQTDPVQTERIFEIINLLPNTIVNSLAKLGPSEFTALDDPIGFSLLEDNPDPVQFFFIADLETTATELSEGIFYPESSFIVPKLELSLELAATQRFAERQAYTFFTLLGDVGGFNGAIIMLPAYMMSWYSAKMFQDSLLQEIPVKTKRRPREKNILQQKFAERTT